MIFVAAVWTQTKGVASLIMMEKCGSTKFSDSQNTNNKKNNRKHHSDNNEKIRRAREMNTMLNLS